MNLGSLHNSQGDVAKARLYLERATRILEATLGPRHTDTKDARQRLSTLPGYRQMKKQPSKKKS